MKPTQKQIDFAQTIGEELGIDPPFGGDKDDYSDFIDENIHEFYRSRNSRRYSEESMFQLDHSYHLQDYAYDRISQDPETV